MSRRPLALVATHVAALGAGYVLAPKQPVDTVVRHTGLFTVDTTKVLATTVESLRNENKLLVFTYKGTAKVSAGHTFLWLFGGEQELIVPAVVSYYLDLSKLSLADVTYDDRAKLVRVALPPVTLGDVAFQPENATTTNGGVLTWSEAQVEALRKAIVPRWGRVRLTDIDGRAVAQWLAAKRADGLAAGTVEKIRAIMSRSFELGRRWGVAGSERNPCRDVPRKPLNNARERYVTADEAARLVEAAGASRNDQLAAVVRLLLLTGMRVSELLSARWEHVDLDRRTLFVPTSKTGRSRHVPLAGAAADVIAGLPRPAGATFLFPNPADPRRHLTTVKHAWQTARDAAGLPDLRIHDLRHSAASFMVNSGVDLFAVGKVLGHASVQSTQRYSHLANSTLLAAVEAGAAKQAAQA